MQLVWFCAQLDATPHARSVKRTKEQWESKVTKHSTQRVTVQPVPQSLHAGALLRVGWTPQCLPSTRDTLTWGMDKAEQPPTPRTWLEISLGRGHRSGP